jgi:hypothetical protein
MSNKLYKIERLDQYEARVSLGIGSSFVISWEDKSKFEKEFDEVIEKYKI